MICSKFGQFRQWFIIAFYFGLAASFSICNANSLKYVEERILLFSKAKSNIDRDKISQLKSLLKFRETHCTQNLAVLAIEAVVMDNASSEIRELAIERANILKGVIIGQNIDELLVVGGAISVREISQRGIIDRHSLTDDQLPHAVVVELVCNQKN